MTDSYEIKIPVFEWLKITGTKIFTDDGMLLRINITLTIWQNKNTSTIRANGGIIQISKTLILCHWDTDLISSRHCPPCNDCDKKQEKNHRCFLAFTSTMGNTKFIFCMVELARLMVDSSSFRKTRKKMRKVLNERTSWLQYLERFFWTRLSWIQLCYRWIVYRSIVTDGECQDNTSNDPFSRCKSV